MKIVNSGPAGGAAGTFRLQRRTGAGFLVPAGAQDRAAATEGPAAAALSFAAAPVGPEAETAVRDRAARRHARDLLSELSLLQQATLAPDGRPAAGVLARLAALAGDVPEAADPALAEIIAGVVLRAKVELARRMQP